MVVGIILECFISTVFSALASFWLCLRPCLGLSSPRWLVFWPGLYPWNGLYPWAELSPLPWLVV